MFACKTKWKRLSAVVRSANLTDIGAINRCWTDASEREALTPSVTQRCTIDADDGDGGEGDFALGINLLGREWLDAGGGATFCCQQIYLTILNKEAAGFERSRARAAPIVPARPIHFQRTPKSHVISPTRQFSSLTGANRVAFICIQFSRLLKNCPAFKKMPADALTDACAAVAEK